MRNVNPVFCRASRTSAFVVIGVALSMVASAAAASGYPTQSKLFRFETMHWFFDEETDGGSPYSTVALGTDGNFYGTTGNGGKEHAGVAYRMTAAGTVSVLHDFYGPTDGAVPGGLALANDGYLYGTARSGGAALVGTVFRLTTAGVLTVLHEFAGADGANPYAAPIQASDGHLYGTTSYGGAYNRGAVYRLTLAGDFTLLHSFKVDDIDGCNPMARLIQATDGNLYGTTYSCGAGSSGTVFRLGLAGSLETIHAFSGSDGRRASSPLLQAADGNFYGMTDQGGAHDRGTVFKLTTRGKFTLLHSFADDGVDGYSPKYSGLIQGADGNFYGTTSMGGKERDGTAFRMSPKGNIRILHSFGRLNDDGSEKDGIRPYGGVTPAPDGTFYGTTYTGRLTEGTVFRLTPK